MKLKRDKAAAGQGRRERSAGRSLWFYFSPSVLVAVVVIVLLGVFTLQSLDKASNDANAAAVKSVANALAIRVAGEVAGLHSQLHMLARSPSVGRALLSGDEAIRRAGSGLQALLPGVIQVRLLPKGEIAPDPDGAAPMGYAGVDMLGRTFAGESPPVEVHQLSSGTPYLAVAVPVKSSGKVVGGLFAAWPLKSIVRQLALVDDFPGVAQLRQGGSDGALLASTGSEVVLQRIAGDLPVQDTIWHLVYSVDVAEAGGEQSLIMALAAGGALALALAMFLQYRVISRDLREDMAVMVNLGEAINAGEGATEHQAKVAASRDAILLLTDLARRTHKGGGAAKSVQQPSQSGAATVESAQAALPDTPAVAASGMVVEEMSSTGPGSAKVLAEWPAHVFRAYDIRGLAGQELDGAFALALGQAFGETGRKAGASQVCVAHDARLSSPELFEAMMQGLISQGLQVKDMGLVPAGHLYFAMHAAAGSAGVMITGSHNPPQYNGFKLFLDGGVPLSTEALQGLYERMRRGEFDQAEGWRESHDVSLAYQKMVGSELQLLRPLKVVVDAGNGAAGKAACELLQTVGCQVLPLFCEPDGHFPHHHPNPADPGTLQALGQAVREQSADLGVAFDGDGDRLGLVDEQGETVRPEHLLMLLAADVLQRNPGMDVLYDVKSSRHLAAFVLGHGGRPIMWKSGHTRMREKMRESGALLGGEFSGHLFIQERWFGNDDAIYAAARVLEVLSADTRACSEVLADLPKSPATSELMLSLDEGEALALMQSLVESGAFGDARIVDIDGLRVEFPEGWGLVRASNTTPSLSFRFEAETEQALQTIQQRFAEVFAQVAPDLGLPF